ncbi:sporulation membrane protein YtaF [Halanaerocella petrolearia]
MDLLAIFILALAISLDGFVVGITYGLKGIKMNYGSILIISIASGITILLAMSLGNLLTNFLAPIWATRIGGIILILIGCWLFYDSVHSLLVVDEKVVKSDPDPREVFTFKIESLGLIINILHKPVKADLDYSGVISKQEALFLGIALALDAFGAGIGAAMVGYQPLVSALLVIGCKFGLLSGGIYLGKKITGNRINSTIRLLPGLILIILGLTKLF